MKTALTIVAGLSVTACNIGKVRRSKGGRYIVSFCPRKFARMAYKRLQNWRAVADVLGHSAAYWNLVARGERKMSRADENALRRRLWLAPKGITRVERMKTSDLAEYIRERRVIG